MYYFLKEDFDALSAEIEKVVDKIKELGQEMGKSCKEGAETFHDNFAYEDGERQQLMWSTRLRELIRIRNQARVVESQSTHETVSLGQIVVFKDENTGKTRVIKVGSYMVLSEKEKKAGAVSYNAPLAHMLIRGKVGDIKEGVIGGKKKIFRILKIK